MEYDFIIERSVCLNDVGCRDCKLYIVLEFHSYAKYYAPDVRFMLGGGATNTLCISEFHLIT